MDSNTVSPPSWLVAGMALATILVGPVASEKAALSAENPCAANPCAENPCTPAPAAELSDSEAAAAYDRIADQLRAGYARSGHPAAAYFNWQQYNRVPYISETHGRRYVNNFANGVAAAYARFEQAGVMPEGAVLAKDSFSVPPVNPCAANPCAANPCAANPCAGQIVEHAGPLFIMEKMEAGFSPESGDWRYTMIMANGVVFGTTKGAGAAKVQFCADCHGTVADTQDSLFFIPDDYRASP
jgi:hypothetical protein